MHIQKTILSIALTLVALGLAPDARAATAQSCTTGTPDASGRVTGTTACEFIADMANSSDYDDVFFGGGFTEIARHEFTGLDLDHLTVQGGASAGSFAIAPGLLALYDTLVLVFKSGSGGNTTPGEAVAYVIGDTLSGDWLSPFTRTTGNCDGTSFTGTHRGKSIDCTRQVSHIALLGRQGDDIPQAPLPGGLVLFLTAGALAFGLRSRQSE